MIILKEIKHDAPTNSVEATWVERTITPAVGVEGEEGYQPERIEDVQIKCHSYADVQMDMLEADIAVLGGNLAEHAALIATVRANIKPPIPPSIAEQKAAIDAHRDEQLRQGFTHNANLYHCDEVFQSQVQAYLLAWQTGILPAGATVQIRRKDNVTETMTRDQVAALAGALMTYVQSVYAASWAAKDAL